MSSWTEIGMLPQEQLDISKCCSEWTLKVTERQLISLRATSSPLILLDTSYIRFSHCCTQNSLSKKQTRIAIASPQRIVPSKMTERYLPSNSIFNRANSCWCINGTTSDMWRQSVRRNPASSSNSHKRFNLFNGILARRKVQATFTLNTLWSMGRVSPLDAHSHPSFVELLYVSFPCLLSSKPFLSFNMLVGLHVEWYNAPFKS